MSIVEAVGEFGYARVPPLSDDQVDDVRHYLSMQPIYPGCHVRHGAGPATRWDRRGESAVACWDMQDAILAPHLLELALRQTDDVAEYLGVDVPLLYSINAFCTQPGTDVRPDIQDWHRDADDAKFLPLFVYLTDVGDDAAQQVRGSRGEHSITGSRGTAFFSNTMLEHRGLRPKTSERIIWWSRWGVSDPPASYLWDGLRPINNAMLGNRYPTDPRLQQSIRLVAS